MSASDRILELVADGTLSPEEADELLRALDEAAAGEGGRSGPTGARPTPSAAGPRSLRIQVTESGRSAVNVRVPLLIGQNALGRIPGLGEENVERVRAALAAGITGTLFEVGDASDGVRISVE